MFEKMVVLMGKGRPNVGCRFQDTLHDAQRLLQEFRKTGVSGEARQGSLEDKGGARGRFQFEEASGPSVKPDTEQVTGVM